MTSTLVFGTEDLQDDLDHPLSQPSVPAIAWRCLQVQVSEWSSWKRKEKCILKNLTGSFQPGSLNGLLGPSGAGKTTLLNVLSGTNTSGLCQESEIYTAEANPTSYFIAQHVTESIVSQLTVGQILRYAYRFKNGLGSSNSKETISKVLTDLLLDPSILDRPFSVCSGGEQKRIAIAQELMSHQVPSFLFLDEPTTGLDSAAAYEVMSSLQAHARSAGLTIIASIHAPNHETLNLFDRLYVLAKGGLAVYQGPPRGIEDFLASQLKNPPLFLSQQPPIECLLKIASSSSSNPLLNTLTSSILRQETSNLTPILPNLLLQASSPFSHRAVFTISNLHTQIDRQLRLLFIAQYRNLLTTILLFLTIFSILSSIFNPDKARPSGCYSLEANLTTCSSETHLQQESLVKENAYYLSYVYIFTSIITMTFSTVSYSSRTAIFRAEHRNGWYSFGVFTLASSITSLLEIALNSVLLTLITYFLSLQHAADGYAINPTRLGLFLAFILLLSLYNATIGQLIATVFLNSPPLAFLVSIFIYASTILFNGLYVHFHRMDSPVLQFINGKLGFTSLSQILYFAIYGVDRCKVGSEYSWILLDYQVEEAQLGEYFAQVLGNIALLQLISLAILYLKLNSLSQRRRHRKLIKKDELSDKRKAENEKTNQQIQLNENESNRNEAIEMKERQVMGNEEERQFRQFSANKILIAWRNL